MWASSAHHTPDRSRPSKECTQTQASGQVREPTDAHRGLLDAMVIESDLRRSRSGAMTQTNTRFVLVIFVVANTCPSNSHSPNAIQSQAGRPVRAARA